MKKIITFFLLIFSLSSYSQLSSGDIAFIEWNSDAPFDVFRFVCLKEVQAGTTIYFTDKEPSAGGVNSSEGTIILTFDQTVPAGDIITISETLSSFPSANASSVIGAVSSTRNGFFYQSPFGDGLWAYTGSLNSPVTFIAAFGNDGNDGFQTSIEGLLTETGLTEGVNSVAPIEMDNYRYNGVLTSGTKEQLLSAINNNQNWIGNNTTHETFSGSFFVDSPQTVIWNEPCFKLDTKHNTNIIGHCHNSNFRSKFCIVFMGKCFLFKIVNSRKFWNKNFFFFILQ